MPVSKINFKAENAAGNNNPGAIKLHKVDDETLRRLAWSQQQNKLNNVYRNTLNVTLVGIPAVDIFLNGLTQKGNLFAKYKKALSSSVRWTAALGAGLALVSAKKSVNKKSEKLSEFNKKHPIITFVADLTAVFGMYAGAVLGVIKGYDALKSKYNKKVVSYEKHIKHALNSSALNKKVVKPYEKYINKNHYAGTAVKTFSALAVPLMFVSAYVRYNKEVKNAVRNANATYNNLKFVNNFLPAKEVE